MIETNDRGHDPKARRRRCFIVGGVFLLLLLLLFIIVLILALTVFKPKEPRTELVSATLEGISFSPVSIQLNITLNLTLLLKNPNHASFKHGPGKSYLLYQGDQVGEADLCPGLIPSKGTQTLPSQLTIVVDEMTLPSILLRHFLPGRVSFLKIFKKHAVATSDCRLAIAIPSMKIQSQECKSKTKL